MHANIQKIKFKTGAYDVFFLQEYSFFYMKSTNKVILSINLNNFMIWKHNFINRGQHIDVFYRYGHSRGNARQALFLHENSPRTGMFL